MKKWLIIFIATFLLTFAGFFYWKGSNSNPPTSSNVLSETDILSPSPSGWPQSVAVNIDDAPIRISWAQVNPKNVELYSNLEEKKLSEEIKVNKSCKILVNGGFYSQNQTHLGLFVNNFETISKPIQSALLNGFLWINANNEVKIGMDLTDNDPRLALQSGPLLTSDGEPSILAINNDEPRRRIAAAITNDNKLIFLAFYREQSEMEGPMLGQLPEIIKLFEKQTNIKIADAINLDGGSHSAFISNFDLLRESSIIGSYFCAKQVR